MSASEKIQWVLVIQAWAGSIIYFAYLNKQLIAEKAKLSAMEAAYKAALKLIFVETQRKAEYAKALKRLTNPESIEEDMEKGARMREMHDANRTALPREDAGPPARVYSPKLRANLPKSNYKG